jgi:hypothetical protein
VTTAPAVLPHVQAVKAAIEAAPLTAYIAGAPAGPAPLPKTYTVIYSDPGTTTAASLADDRTVLDFLVQITCVATTAEGALGTLDRVAQALDAPLAVDGRDMWKPERLGGPPERRDDDLTTPLYYLPVQYRLRSITA